MVTPNPTIIPFVRARISVSMSKVFQPEATQFEACTLHLKKMPYKEGFKAEILSTLE